MTGMEKVKVIRQSCFTMEVQEWARHSSGNRNILGGENNGSQC